MKFPMIAAILLLVGMVASYAVYSITGPNFDVEDYWYAPFHTQEYDNSKEEVNLTVMNSVEETKTATIT